MPLQNQSTNKNLHPSVVRPLAAYGTGHFKSSPKANPKPSDDLSNHRLNIGYTVLNLTLNEQHVSILLFQWRFLSFHTILNTIMMYFPPQTLFLYYLFDLTWYKGGQIWWLTCQALFVKGRGADRNPFQQRLHYIITTQEATLEAVADEHKLSQCTSTSYHFNRSESQWQKD